MRRTTSNLPLLERPEGNWQAGGCQGASCFGLTEIVYCSPVFELSDQSARHRPFIMSIEILKRRERLRILRPIRLDGRVVRYRWSDILQVENELMDHWEGTTR